MEKALVLVVDDEPASRYALKKALSSFRFTFQEAGDGKEALEKIELFNPDLVILDADPLTDIRNTQRIHAVIVRGKLLDRKRLDTMLATR